MPRPTRPPRLARLLVSLPSQATCVRSSSATSIRNFTSNRLGRRAAPRRADCTCAETLASIAAVRRDARDCRRADRPAFLRRPLEGLTLDLKSVLRVLRRSPGYAAVAVLSLAIGIGANTAIFSVVRQLVLMPLPVEGRRSPGSFTGPRVSTGRLASGTST